MLPLVAAEAPAAAAAAPAAAEAPAAADAPAAAEARSACVGHAVAAGMLGEAARAHVGRAAPDIYDASNNMNHAHL